MSLSGFMKQLNKANQMLNEKIGGAKGTEIDGTFQIMEKKTDVIYRLVDDIRDKTNEYLQPNPASRAKLWTVNNLSKMRGQVKNTPYPQPEGTLGETMIKYGKDLGDDSNFGTSLVDMGEALRQMAGIKYALEDNIKQNFLDPLAQIKDNELKEVMHLRKKTENRRLDYDCKKRKKSQNTMSVTDEELSLALEKFEESKNQAENSMNRLLNNELEQITYLTGFAEGFLEYHNQCYEILKDMVRQLNEKKKKLSNEIPIKNFESSGKSFRNSNNNLNGGFGNVKSAGSDTSSAASRIYDNSVESSSLGENLFFNDQHQPSRTMSQTNGKTNNQGSIKMPPTYNISAPPPVSQRLTQGSIRTNREACCKALYDFEAENEEELEFKEGAIIKLVAHLDENWLKGELHGRQGRFPISYVEMVVPLP